ncbi:MAG: RIP metalloprotease RseP [Lysobacteraceae bacterium]|nr:MAG: RIP metalloprotease RseP [Xanthomonadaceae bacterium]
MSEFLGSAWWLIVALGVLVTFHEFGHYWVARRCAVRVQRFSVGFGKPLWMRRGKDGTEWVIAAIPLGGYVKMLDEREGEVREHERDEAFNHKTVGQRMAIVAAGPLANLVLCIALFWAMFVIGRPDFAPVVGHVDGVAAQSGLRRGDTLIAVGERQTPTWTEAQWALLTAAMDRGPVDVQVRDAEDRPLTRRMDFSRMPEGVDLRQSMQAVGLTPRHRLIPPVIGEIKADSPASRILQVGDRILSIGGAPIRDWSDIAPLAARFGAQGAAAPFEIERQGARLTVALTPARHDDGKSPPSWKFGLTPAAPPAPAKDAILRYGPIDAVPAALRETWFQTGELFDMFARAFSGQLAVRDTVSGPIGIARAANMYAKNGLAWYLSLLAALSLSLAILNLLPIPILDGGHLLYYLIELVKGSPLSERAMAAGHYVGLALLLGLMGLAFYNDLQGLIQ